MKRLLLAVVVQVAACGGPADGKLDLAGGEVEVAVPTDLSGDFRGGEEEVEVRPDSDAGLATDGAAESVAPGCEWGSGCFLDPCSENAQCQEGYCVLHLGEGVCTRLCEVECPPGWACRQLATGPDVVFACISKVANLCRPCAGGNECKSPGGAEDLCIDYGVQGSFCGGLCASDGDCPWGFSCQEAASVDGVKSKQCLADAGICPCTAKSIELGLWTPCEVANEWGSCSGKRSCTADGLSDCDAPLPVAESCNGVDDDCDGEVDEPVFQGGKWLDLCDDGNDCTTDSCLGTASCHHELLDGVECKDGNSCTVADHCEQGLCVGSPVTCDDSNPCTDDSCNEAGGCIFTVNSAKCDDLDPCTVADECTAGVCHGVTVPCDCLEDSDCVALEDGNLCNGTLHCDLVSWPYQCRVKPGTALVCPEPPAGPDAICLQAACEPVSGNCSLVPNHEGLACDDGDLCTYQDLCVQGKCAAGLKLSCVDENPCTQDGCLPGVGCVHTALSGGECSDGDACTTGDSCFQGKCQGSGQLGCDDGNACTADSCLPASGCSHVPAAGPCDDGNQCTVGDSCKAGKCAPGNALNCADDNPCTTDVCLPASGCQHNLNTAPCDDQNLCTVGDHCHLGGCIGSATLVCNDGNLCTTDSCDPDTGCLFVPNLAACNDGNQCTVGDKCSGGWCLAAANLDCDDGNSCTDDGCLAASGCTHLPNLKPCEDGDLCTLGDSCQAGICLAGSDASCDDDESCTTDSCDPAKGCLHSPVTGACSDGNKCTLNDYCFNSTCQPGAEALCNDSNKCTQDSCDPAIGCLYTPVAPCCGNGIEEAGEECDDGNGNEADGCSSDCKLGAIVVVKLWGAGGSSGDNSNTLIGGPGGYTSATFKVPSGTTLRVLVGQGGQRYGLAQTFGGGGGGGDNPSYDGGSGGGGTFLFVQDSMPANNSNLLAVAGGGGGCAGTFGNPNSGGPGGGLNGGDGFGEQNAGEVGKGGTQSAGGQQGSAGGGTPGQFLQGGMGNGTTSNVGSGGGGGGYFGSGGGAGRSGAGGGGSGYVNASPGAGILFLSGSTTGSPSSGGAASKSPPATSDPDYGQDAGKSFNSGSYHGNPGRVVITVGEQKSVFGYTGTVQTLVVQ